VFEAAWRLFFGFVRFIGKYFRINNQRVSKKILSRREEEEEEEKNSHRHFSIDGRQLKCL
jgi:hypothetical protein